MEERNEYLESVKRVAELREQRREEEERAKIKADWENYKRKVALEEKLEADKQKYRKPKTIPDGEATLLYIVVLIGSLIFKDWWIIWIIATFMWLKNINRD